ncbi:MAG: response regulator transcription factor [Thermoflexales bacterium]|nr:response regulator transcription factor [Thermoflexales bacterium]
MNAPVKILVVDDEAGIRSFLEELLTRDGHQVVAAESGEVALEYAASQTFDLALVDLRMKGIDGMQVMSALYQRSPDTVVIVITGHGSLETAIEALRHGAHDYLFKPVKAVQVRESVRTALLKRKRNLRQHELLGLTRRLIENMEGHDLASPGLTQLPPASPSDEQGRFLERGHLIVDAMRHVVTLDGHVLELSPTEFEIMAYLANEAPRVVSPQELVRAMQGYECEAWEASEMLRYHIHRIRHKVKHVSGRTDLIRTVRGVGYTIES